jgi:5'-3' exonuclease
MYRAYHAMRGSGLSGPGGRSTHAVYIFVTMLRKLIQDHQPQYIAASFDLAGPTFRDDLVADYKANRAPMPPDLAEQIPWVHEACEAMGVPILTYERFEADDVIGTLACRAVEQGFEVAIVTGDKDFFQLVHDGIKVYNPRDDGTWYDAAGVKEKFGVAPSQVVDVLALMGDSIDNIKGVPGIGEKGARDLIATYGSLENLLAHAGEVSNKRQREGLLAHAADARQSRELATIRTERAGRVRPGAAAVPGDRASAASSCSRAWGSDARAGVRADRRHRRQGLRGRGHDRGRPRAGGGARGRGPVGLRVLPAGPAAMRAGIAGLAFSLARRQARYVPLTDAVNRTAATSSTRRPGERARRRADALAELKPLLEDPASARSGTT